MWLPPEPTHLAVPDGTPVLQDAWHAIRALRHRVVEVVISRIRQRGDAQAAGAALAVAVVVGRLAQGVVQEAVGRICEGGGLLPPRLAHACTRREGRQAQCMFQAGDKTLSTAPTAQSDAA